MAASSASSSSHPLKGILNTNDDPFRCATCLESMGRGRDVIIIYCCGKAVCMNCSNAGKSYDERADRCLLCNATHTRTIDLLKKQSKRGRPWAQAQLGIEYHRGNTFTQSYYEAVRWYRKAAAKVQSRQAEELRVEPWRVHVEQVQHGADCGVRSGVPPAAAAVGRRKQRRQAQLEEGGANIRKYQQRSKFGRPQFALVPSHERYQQYHPHDQLAHRGEGQIAREQAVQWYSSPSAISRS